MLLLSAAAAQQPYADPSPHARLAADATVVGIDTVHVPFAADLNAPLAPPFSVVYGWMPSWTETAARQSVDHTLLTHVAWFSVAVDTGNGALTGLAGWRSTPTVAWATERGLKTHLTVTCFGGAATEALLRSDAKRTRCIADIATAVRERKADGVNIDFESVRGSQRSNLTLFMKELRDSLPTSELTMAIPAVDWGKAFDVVALARTSTFLVMMGYDYYWDGSPTAGPVAPLDGESYDVTSSVNAYLAAGLQPSKLVLAMPLYGRRWPVTSTQRKATASATAKALSYAAMHTQPGFDARSFDGSTSTAWWNNADTTGNRQFWVDDSTSLIRKYQFAKAKSLLGVGYWALGYDAGRRSVWDGLASMHDATSVVEQAPDIDPQTSMHVYSVLGRLVVTTTAAQLADLSLSPGCYLAVPSGQPFSRAVRILR